MNDNQIVGSSCSATAPDGKRMSVNVEIIGGTSFPRRGKIWPRIKAAV